MRIRAGILLIFLLGVAWTCDARQMGSRDKLINIETSAMQINHRYQGQEIIISEDLHNPKVCQLCEEYTSLALNYLSENKTQSEIIDILHSTCSQLHSFELQCTTLVDYYAPIFFQELASIEPQEFCKRTHLCQNIVMIASQVKGNSCDFCHQTISELLDKLKNPDNQLEIIETLLKLCSTLQNHAKQCKSLVFHYGPLVLANAQTFLETTDICTIIRACKASTSEGQLASVLGDMPSVTAF